MAVAVVPEHQGYTFRLGILRQFGHTLASDVLIPPVVNKTVLITHLGSKVNELHLVVVVD